MPSGGNMVWMDLEMTGLDPEKDTILEIATIITDGQLQVLAEGPVFAIRHAKSALDAMDPWCVKQHGSSGLTQRCLESDVDLAEAELRTLEQVREHCREGESPLCGNSIHHDRRFLIRGMPSLHAYLSYRLVDVSTIKELVQRWYPQWQPPQKRQSHLALDDIRESIAELQAYRERFFKAD